MNRIDQKVEVSRLDAVKKNRRSRIARAVFGAVVIGSLVGLLVLATATLAGVQEQLKAVEKLAQEIKATSEQQDLLREQQLNRVIRHLDCIVLLFQQEDRANVRIEDINNCTLDTTEGGASSFSVPPFDTSSTSQAPVAVAGEQPAPSATPAPANPNPSPEPQPQPAPPPPPSPETPPEPQPGLVRGILHLVDDLLGL